MIFGKEPSGSHALSDNVGRTVEKELQEWKDTHIVETKKQAKMGLEHKVFCICVPPM